MPKIISVAGVLILGLLLPAILSAREPVRVEMDGSVLSRFVWRGDMWTDDPVYWQTVTFRYSGFRYYNFFNIDLTDINDNRCQINEYDVIFDYSFGFDTFSIAPGVLHFSSPTGYFEPSTKITLEIRIRTLLNPRFRVRIDPTGSKGSYLISSFEQPVHIPVKRLSVVLYGSLGMSEPRYYGRGFSETPSFTDLLLGMSLPLAISKNITMSPVMEYTSLLGHDLRNGIKLRGRPGDAMTYSIGISRSFDF